MGFDDELMSAAKRNKYYGRQKYDISYLTAITDHGSFASGLNSLFLWMDNALYLLHCDTKILIICNTRIHGKYFPILANLIN